MAQPAVYDQAYCFCNGILLVENASIKVEYQADDQDVFTLAKGFAGQTPSPRSMMITIEEFVPPAGFEFDLIGKWLTSERVTFAVQLGSSGLKLQSDGFIRTPGFEAGVGQSAKITAVFRGEARNFS